MTRVLIVGSLEGELGQAGRIASARGAKLGQADGVSSALARARADGCDLILCDVQHDVGWLVQSLDAERIVCPVVACGRQADASAAVRAIRAGAKEFLPLPPEPDLIAAMIQAAAGEGDAPVYRDPAMAALLMRAEAVARAEASILITGESGTGKEVLARHVHRHSRRTNGPFVALNCAALPESLLESELFGHEKGAFSGAVASRRGKFEQADGGTLLLDEIGEMDVRLQAKILRVLQEREVDRLGGGAPVKVDVRILAATNRDLGAEVRAGRFREDLLFRLRVVSLRIPALRERPGDILPIAEHYSRRYADANGYDRRDFSPGARRMLLDHSWPGNVRELENAVHRAVLLAGGDEIGSEAIELDAPSLHGFGAPQASEPAAGLVAIPASAAVPADPGAFTPGVFAPAGSPQAAPPAPRPAPGVSALVGRRMEDVERDLILETLGHCLGNRTRAAEILGISIRTLRNKLHEYRAAGRDVPLAPGQQPLAAFPSMTASYG